MSFVLTFKIITYIKIIYNNQIKYSKIYKIITLIIIEHKKLYLIMIIEECNTVISIFKKICSKF